VENQRVGYDFDTHWNQPLMSCQLKISKAGSVTGQYRNRNQRPSYPRNRLRGQVTTSLFHADAATYNHKS
jgi:hypothetical protein